MRNLVNAMRKLIGRPLAKLALRVCGVSTVQQAIFATYEYPVIMREYGDFRLDRDYSDQHIKGLSKESGTIRGVIVEIIRRIKPGISRALLPGEYNIDKTHYAGLFGIDETAIITAGVGGDMDFDWNYENDPPEMGRFDLIISQAMLEHLIDPYKHVADLCGMLNPGGSLILHTHIPGFGYHRYPIDCVRFYPDWFEAVADRLGLTVYDRFIGELRVCYTLQKPG